MENRIIEVETQLAFLEKTVDELNEVIYNQQKQLDLLKQENLIFKKQLAKLTEDSENIDATHTKPPHY